MKCLYTIRICSNAAKSRGYKPDEFYDVTTVAGEDIVKQHPELQ